MPKFDTILQNERRLRAFTGLSAAIFTAFLPHFASAMEHNLNRSTIDGYIRDGGRAITYTNSPLPTPADRLLFISKRKRVQPTYGDAKMVGSELVIAEKPSPVPLPGFLRLVHHSKEIFYIGSRTLIDQTKTHLQMQTLPQPSHGTQTS